MKKSRILLSIMMIVLIVLSFAAVACVDDSEKEQYTVTLDYNTTQGTVSLSPTAAGNKYDEGTQLTVNVTAKSGFEIDKVMAGTQELSATDGAYKFTLNADTTVKVTFKTVSTGGEDPNPPAKKQYTVTLNYNSSQGTVSLSPTAAGNKYDEGTQITVMVTANNGFAVDTVTVGGQSVTLSGNTYKFTLNADTTVTVTFKTTSTGGEDPTPPSGDKQYTVTLDYNSSQGSVVLSPTATGNKYKEGTTITVIVNAFSGYEVESVTAGTLSVEKSGNTYTFTLTSDVTVKVTFKSTGGGSDPSVDGYATLTLTYDTQAGTARFEPSETSNRYQIGTYVTVYASAKEGYIIKEAYVDQQRVDVPDSGMFTFEVTHDMVIQVVFESTATDEPVPEGATKPYDGFIGTYSGEKNGTSYKLEIRANGRVYLTIDGQRSEGIVAATGQYYLNYTLTIVVDGTTYTLVAYYYEEYDDSWDGWFDYTYPTLYIGGDPFQTGLTTVGLHKE